MGAVLNSLPLNETENLENISPNRADWLTSHADATGLAVVEVERLWNRFKQLTGSKDQTKLYPDATAASSEIANDIFVRNVGFNENNNSPDRSFQLSSLSIAYKTFSSLKN